MDDLDKTIPGGKPPAYGAAPQPKSESLLKKYITHLKLNAPTEEEKAAALDALITSNGPIKQNDSCFAFVLDPTSSEKTPTFICRLDLSGGSEFNSELTKQGFIRELNRELRERRLDGFSFSEATEAEVTGPFGAKAGSVFCRTGSYENSIKLVAFLQRLGVKMYTQSLDMFEPSKQEIPETSKNPEQGEKTNPNFRGGPPPGTWKPGK